MAETEEKATEMMPGPGPEHERLRPFEGTFRATVKIHMGPGDPVVSTGTMHNRFILGDRFLAQDYKGDTSEGPFPNFEGRGYWGFNTVNSRYEGVWIDNASTMMQVEAGAVDSSGRQWTMTGDLPDPQTGGVLRKRTVITLVDDDHHRMETFFSREGQEFRAMEIAYVRAD